MSEKFSIPTPAEISQDYVEADAKVERLTARIRETTLEAQTLERARRDPPDWTAATAALLAEDEAVAEKALATTAVDPNEIKRLYRDAKALKMARKAAEQERTRALDRAARQTAHEVRPTFAALAQEVVDAAWTLITKVETWNGSRRDLVREYGDRFSTDLPAARVPRLDGLLPMIGKLCADYDLDDPRERIIER